MLSELRRGPNFKPNLLGERDNDWSAKLVRSIMMANRQSKRGSYSLTDVRASGEPNVFIVTVLRDGRKVGEVRVQSTSPNLAYFNQPDLHPSQSTSASKAYDFSI